MEHHKASPEIEQSSKRSPQLSWHFIRKLEALVFASLFLAVPFFAYRIVNIAGTTLVVQNCAVDLMKDLIRAREIAKGYGLVVTVVSVAKTGKEPCLYRVQSNVRTIEEVVLPNGVCVVGSVIFDEKGSPQSPASFIVSKGMKTACVEVDALGQTVVH